MAFIAVAAFMAFNGNKVPGSNTQSLTVVVTNIKDTSGKPLYVGVYREQDGFPEYGKTWKQQLLYPAAGEARVTFDLPFGDYAVAVSHDLNKNGKLDTNLVGFPKEPFGFSTNFKPKMSRPGFGDCRFRFAEDTPTINITLID